MKKYFLIFLFLVFAITGHEKRDKELERCAVTSNYFVSEQIFDDENSFLFFEIYPRFEKEIYEDPMWSVKIIDYKVNGVAIDPEYIATIFFSFINSRKVVAQDSELFLRFGYWGLMTGEFVGDDDIFKKIYSFSGVNDPVNNVEIKYVFTYADGSYDPGCYVLKATRKN